MRGVFTLPMMKHHLEKHVLRGGGGGGAAFVFGLFSSNNELANDGEEGCIFLGPLRSFHAWDQQIHLWFDRLARVWTAWNPKVPVIFPLADLFNHSSRPRMHPYSLDRTSIRSPPNHQACRCQASSHGCV